MLPLMCEMKLRTKLIICNLLLGVVITVIALSGIFYVNDAAKGGYITLDARIISEVRSVMSSLNVFSDYSEEELEGVGYRLREYGFNYFIFDQSGYVQYTNTDDVVEKRLAEKHHKVSQEQAVTAEGGCIILSQATQGGWIVVINSQKSILSRYKLYLTLYIVSLIVASVLMILAVTLSENVLLTPRLNAIKQAMHQVYMGNYERIVEVDLSKKDELSEVLNEFEMLRKKLYDLDKEKDAFDRERGMMISGISHDLRTPLSIIQGYAKGIKDGVARRIGKESEYIEKIYATSLTMNGLIDKLSQFAKMQSKEVMYTMQEQDICDIIDDYVKKNYLQYTTRGIVINATLPKAPRLIVNMDKSQFVRVLQNICENSLKYKEKSVAHLSIKVYDDGECAVVILADDGPGINNFEADYIFESYYRGDQSRTNPVSGSGLGLSIVKNVVSAHKGQVTAYNDNGLTIKIQIPIRRRK